MKTVIDLATRRQPVLGARETSVDEALARSITREAGSRFAPLLVTDNAGRFVGIARMERLIGKLAGTK